MAITDFLDFMPETITRQVVTGYNTYGAPEYDETELTYPARVSNQVEKTKSRREDGQDVLASPVIWVGEAITDMNVDDKITLSDGSQPKIVNFETIPDETGPHHTKIYCRGNLEV